MYTIAFPIHICPVGPTVFCLPAGLARDIIAQLRYEKDLHIMCPVATSPNSVSSPYYLDAADYPGLRVTLLPYNGRLNYCTRLFKILRILKRAAETSSVWHTGCSTKLFDLTSASYYIGRFFAHRIRVVCLDSDPASMMGNSGPLQQWKAPIIRARYRKWVRQVDAAIFVGQGTENSYGRFCRKFVTTSAVWLNEGDLADADSTVRKFDQLEGDIIRMALPSRLYGWKGCDDVLEALKIVNARLPAWHLDIIGDGPMKAELQRQAKEFGDRVSFLGEISYGDPFFAKLQSYHIVLAPTRGLEEARIAYDAAASGCVLLHSGTTTLNKAMRDVPVRWQFEPGSVQGIAHALLDMFELKALWKSAALRGIDAMRGRTIQEMHKARALFLRSLAV